MTFTNKVVNKVGPHKRSERFDCDRFKSIFNTVSDDKRDAIHNY